MALKRKTNKPDVGIQEVVSHLTLELNGNRTRGVNPVPVIPKFDGIITASPMLVFVFIFSDEFTYDVNTLL